MRFSVIEFPGSNCDHDCVHVLESVLKQRTDLVWHQEPGLPFGTDCVVVPGGFSYGDYLRCGAIARFSPVMGAVKEFAGRGGLVLGICNGFQILTEAGLLPGALLRNRSLKFICEMTHLRVENAKTPFTNRAKLAQVLAVPIAHGEGNYFCEPETLKELKQNHQVAFRYCDPKGRVTAEANPNGSLENIAGITNLKGNVLGMMPHPERVSEPELGGADGRILFESILNALVIR
jgi:phosphoribosylformylglycinamidine synthase subunit PurQ / glutaminase